MNKKPILCPSPINGPSNGGDYVTEGMMAVQQSVAGALTPVA